MPTFVVTIEYVRPLPEIEAATPDHRAWLRGLLDCGQLMVSGPFVPRSGGMLLIKAETPEELERLLLQDPFAQRKLASYMIRQWNPVMGAERLV